MNSIARMVAAAGRELTALARQDAAVQLLARSGRLMEGQADELRNAIEVDADGIVNELKRTIR